MWMALGLISGTSMDGVDAVLVDAARSPAGACLVQVRLFRSYPYTEEMRQALRDCAASGSVADVARLNVAVGEVFAESALSLLADAGVEAGQVRCIGSHGQTLMHLPEPTLIVGRTVRATLQIGEPAVIAARTSITTVADFRPSDMAHGGEGAPLVPLLDAALFGGSGIGGRVLVNIGGIANITVLPPADGSARHAPRSLEGQGSAFAKPGQSTASASIIAFDTGPGNVLIDAAARRMELDGDIDRDGALASGGCVDPDLLAELMQHPFFARSPPKSADSADFLGDYAERCWKRAEELADADLMATLAELTASTVAASIRDHVDWLRPDADRADGAQVVVSGGGVHNRALMSRLRHHVSPVQVAELGAGALGSARERPAADMISADAKEAAAFALIALRTLDGAPGNVPSATGATCPAVLGKVVFAGGERLSRR